MKQKYSFKDILIIMSVCVVVGGGVFAFAWTALDSGYGACLIVRCVKIIP